MSFAGRQTVLSGIRATGRLHLGNYLGVLERFARLSQQSDKRCLFFIADLHTLTTLKDAAKANYWRGELAPKEKALKARYPNQESNSQMFFYHRHDKF